MTPPILMIAFNRPDHARRVLEAVRNARPARLYIAIDGPREGREDDRTRVAETIRVFDTIDWECTVTRLVREKNLGCKQAVSSAITWFFGHEPYGIILEDDCLPAPSFFGYAAHLLERYKDDASVMHINGVNFQDGHWRGSSTYYFSKVCHVWGWASWARAWRKYDIGMEGLEEFFRQNLQQSVITPKGDAQYWLNAFSATKAGKIDTWDYQWVFTVWKNNGLSVMPNVNMVSNIGFDEHATHTKSHNPAVSNKPLDGIEGEIKDSDLIVPNYEGDEYSFASFTNKVSRLHKVRKKLKRIAGLK